MGETKIQWAEKTWSPVLGCTKVSAGCRNCYAIRTLWRIAHNPNPKVKAAHDGLVTNEWRPLPEVAADFARGIHLPPGSKLTMYASGEPTGPLRWTGTVRCLSERLDQPSHWKKPARIFVCPMADLFHEKVPDQFIDRVLDVVATNTWDCDRHRFLFLTKRPERMRNATERWLERHAYHRGVPCFWEGDTFPSHCWFGVSAEDQRTADQRIPILMSMPVQHRWVSAEPLLGPLDLSEWLYPGGIEWVVAGCESGKDARPDDIEWYRSLMRQCRPALGESTALYIKQTRINGYLVHMPAVDTTVYAQYPPELVTK